MRCSNCGAEIDSSVLSLNESDGALCGRCLAEQSDPRHDIEQLRALVNQQIAESEAQAEILRGRMDELSDVVTRDMGDLSEIVRRSLAHLDEKLNSVETAVELSDHTPEYKQVAGLTFGGVFGAVVLGGLVVRYCF